MNNNTSILAVIPARSGSKGVPQKNIKLLNGQPLISYAIKTALACEQISRVVVSTDSAEFAELSKKLGAEVPFIRPNILSGDRAELIDVNKHCLDYYRNLNEEFSGVVSLQPTAPFLKPESLTQAIDMLFNTQADCITSIAEITQGHPYIAKSLNEESQIENFCIIPPGEKTSPRQARRAAYYLTGAFYLRSANFLDNIEKNDKHGLGGNTKAVILDSIEAIDINTPLDFKFAEFIAREEIF
jgi:CMP-N,N'-diacetyllegionaminic acid synthase